MTLKLEILALKKHYWVLIFPFACGTLSLGPACKKGVPWKKQQEKVGIKHNKLNSSLVSDTRYADRRTYGKDLPIICSRCKVVRVTK